MRISKTERLFDLVIALLNTRRYRSAAWVHEHVAGYQSATGEDAFARMFERDKQELRDLGIPIETDAFGDGYRIRPGDFALPEMSFTPAESAALAVASRLWDTTVLGDAQTAALRKLRDAEVDASETAIDDEGDEHGLSDPATGTGPDTAPMHLRLRTPEHAFAGLFSALRARRAVRFDYRGPSDGEARTRHVQPWGLVNDHGAWYVVGYDTDRSAPRTFRLSRIIGAATAVGPGGAVATPNDVDLAGAVRAHDTDRAPSTAVLRIRQGVAAGLRRRGEVIEAGTLGPDGSTEYDDVRVPMRSLADMARHVAGHGPDAVVLSPPELREAVTRLLVGAVG